MEYWKMYLTELLAMNGFENLYPAHLKASFTASYNKDQSCLIKKKSHEKMIFMGFIMFFFRSKIIPQSLLQPFQVQLQRLPHK